MGDRVEQLIQNLNKAIVGKEAAIRLVLTALFSGGHALLEDVPGVGKTLLAKSLARCIDGSFQRIQCTPDLLPSDITGT
ncbi:MAG: MoxR family ATPase, partial [Cyanobacteria bacterium]|nr:MoxR family ATPase [Cyanobacteriota bacterium]